MNTYDLKLVMTYAVSAHFQNGEEYKNYGTRTNKAIIQTHLGEINQQHMCFVDYVKDECAEIADKIIKAYDVNESHGNIEFLTSDPFIESFFKYDSKNDYTLL